MLTHTYQTVIKKLPKNLDALSGYLTINISREFTFQYRVWCTSHALISSRFPLGAFSLIVGWTGLVLLGYRIATELN